MLPDCREPTPFYPVHRPTFYLHLFATLVDARDDHRAISTAASMYCEMTMTYWLDISKSTARHLA